MTKPIVVALYARVSSDEQREQQTIKTQLEYARGRAKLEGWKLVEFLDDGVSGKKVPFAKRPGGAALLAAARRGDFQLVVTYRLDRLGRRARFIHDAIEDLAASGAAYRSLTEPFDTDAIVGKLFLGVLALMAEFESDSIAQRMSDGKQRVSKLDNRRLTGVVPYGYAQGEEHRLVIDPAEAEVVKQVYAWSISGWSHPRIARELNIRRVPTHSDGPGKRKKVKLKEWARPAVTRILSSEIYAGRASFFKASKQNDVVYRNVPAIVTAATYLAARQATSANNKFATAHAKHDYQLRGLVKCGRCGHTITGRQWRSRHGYYCKYCLTGERAFVEERPVLDIIWKDVLDFLDHPDATLRALARSATESGNSEQQAEAELLQLAQRLRELDDRESQLVEMRLSKTITPQIYESKYRAVGREREHTKMQMEAVRDSRAAAVRAVEESESVRQLLGSLRAAAEQSTRRTEIIRLVTKSVVVYVTNKRPRLHVTYAFGPRVPKEQIERTSC